MTDPPFLQPFVGPYEPVEPVAAGELDVYLPSGAEPRPAVVLVRGGPLPAELPRRPRSWPAYRGYGSVLAAAGVAGVMFEYGHRSDTFLRPYNTRRGHSALGGRPPITRLAA